MAGRSSNGVEINRVTLLALGVVAAIIYAVYSFLPSSESVLHTKAHATWKTRSFHDISEDVKSRVEKVQVSEMEVSYMYDKDVRLKIFYRESPPYDKNEKAQHVVLVHGAGDDSKWWEDIGTIQILSASGFHVFAIDLPGWGHTKTKHVDDPGKFLNSFFVEVGIRHPILVAASLGGAYALPYLMGSDPINCESRAAGFVPIAIVRTEHYKPAQYHRCSVPTMIVYGTKDTKLGLYSVGDLRNMANSEIFPMEKAGHACVRERPEEWHRLLYNFVSQIAPRK